MNVNIKFIKWDINEKQTRHGDFLAKAEFVDGEGKRYEWYPRLEDISHIQQLVGAVDSAQKLNKLHKNK